MNDDVYIKDLGENVQAAIRQTLANKGIIVPDNFTEGRLEDLEDIIGKKAVKYYMSFSGKKEIMSIREEIKKGNRVLREASFDPNDTFNNTYLYELSKIQSWGEMMILRFIPKENEEGDGYCIFDNRNHIAEVRGRNYKNYCDVNYVTYRNRPFDKAVFDSFNEALKASTKLNIEFATVLLEALLESNAKTGRPVVLETAIDKLAAFSKQDIYSFAEKYCYNKSSIKTWHDVVKDLKFQNDNNIRKYEWSEWADTQAQVDNWVNPIKEKIRKKNKKAGIHLF